MRTCTLACITYDAQKLKHSLVNNKSPVHGSSMQSSSSFQRCKGYMIEIQGIRSILLCIILTLNPFQKGPVLMAKNSISHGSAIIMSVYIYLRRTCSHSEI